MHSLTLRHVLARTTTELHDCNVDSPRLSAEVLTAFALGKERHDLLKDLILTPEQEITPEQYAAVLALVRRRSTGIPVAYLMGEKEFYGRPFAVSPATLIPRPETELLIDEACQFARQWEKTTSSCRIFADLGTGSGCIGISLACELPYWRGVLIDKSAAALAVARNNALLLQHGHIMCVQADFCLPLFKKHSVSMFITNPPYIGEEEYQSLDREVKHFEPKSALVPTLPYAGSQKETPAACGLEHAKILVEQAAHALCPGGLFLMEIGCGQKNETLALFSSSVWRQYSVQQDLAGLPRYARAVRC